MTCRFLDEVLLLDSVRFDETEARALELHAADCPECSPVLERLRSARGVVLSQSAAVPMDARARVWAGVTAERADHPLFIAPRAIVALTAFATVMVVWLVFFRRAAVEELPPPMIAVSEQPKVEDEWVAFSRGRVRPLSGAKWRASDDGISASIVLEAGAIDVELDGVAPVEIQTVDARIRALAGRVSISRVLSGTEVRASKGKVDIWARGRSLPVSLGEGKSLLVIGAREVPRVSNRERDRERERERVRAEIERARSVVESDPPRAAELAERVLGNAPPAELAAEALAVLADAQRRRGWYEEAAGSYAKLRDHPRGGGYAEEAMLQRALLLERLRALDDALGELARLEAKYPSGVSAPERAALEAKIHLLRNDPRSAAQAILRVRFEGRSRALENRRVEVFNAISKIDPLLAEKLMKGSSVSGNTSPEENR